MDALHFDLSQKTKVFKLLNATNGGPWHKRHNTSQYRSNFAEYKAARIPFTRNHDSRFDWCFTHDISEIFRDFDADENNPDSYDFACTDENILCALDAGTKTFFRLGQSIEHEIKKHYTLPPKDFGKWARICEHIIRHYTEGWADGFQLDMPYWEIWNEPDLSRNSEGVSAMWSGTDVQFYDLYEITAKHLKKCFPHLKIGGPALAWNEQWADGFLAEMQKRQVPMDFFSWHVYCTEPEKMVAKAERIKALLVKYGYADVESILNEWNYIRGWTEDFKYSILAIHGVKGAAFTMACISEAQRSDNIDMLMYYDTRHSSFCGAFDLYSYEPLKGYYPLMWYGKFYDLEGYVPCQTAVDHLYTLCGVDKDGKAMAVITYYNDDDEAAERQVSVDFGRAGQYEICLLDEDHDGENMGATDQLSFTMKNFTSILIREL